VRLASLGAPSAGRIRSARPRESGCGVAVRALRYRGVIGALATTCSRSAAAVIGGRGKREGGFASRFGLSTLFTCQTIWRGSERRDPLSTLAFRRDATNWASLSETGGTRSLERRVLLEIDKPLIDAPISLELSFRRTCVQMSPEEAARAKRRLSGRRRRRDGTEWRKNDAALHAIHCVSGTATGGVVTATSVRTAAARPSALARIAPHALR